MSGVPLNLADTITLVGNIRPWLERLRDERDAAHALLREIQAWLNVDDSSEAKMWKRIDAFLNDSP